MSDHARYADAGVDIDAGNETVRRIRGLARSTFTNGVLSDIGAFGGLFHMEPGRFKNPVLVSSADGIGTKLRVAFLADRHDSIGIDLVNHCVNDILAQGAEPLFFLDYFATGRLFPDVVEAVVSGLTQACRENGCALLGGETAEMPDFYREGEYDVAGFIVGIVERDQILSGRGIVEGDQLIGVPSSGLHTNGFSLARRIAFDQLGLTVDSEVPALGASVGDTLLEPHRSYLSLVRPLLGSGRLKAIAHITGGGLTENVPRVLPRGMAARIDPSTWEPLPVFGWLQEQGAVLPAEMFRTFNMGIGLVLVVDRDKAEQTLEELAARGGRDSRIIGEVVASVGEPTVMYQPVP
jgi:phosphoribosylformylglycinamidine cyclo-ligase